MTWCLERKVLIGVPALSDQGYKGGYHFLVPPAKLAYEKATCASAIRAMEESR
jgi:hypothetical protein